MTDQRTGAHRIIAQHRRARFDYTIVETVEAGLVLMGSEVKSLRAVGASVTDSFVDPRDDALWLLQLHIPLYAPSKHFGHTDPLRPRKLLLHRRQMHRLSGLVRIKGMTVIPLSLYFDARNRVKTELAVVKGKKQHDKRQTEKERDWQREKARVLKGELGS
jgi:SsrA-binding protein